MKTSRSARMLKAFEYWFGKYPFYEDGYKLVTVSYPGMRHQAPHYGITFATDIANVMWFHREVAIRFHHHPRISA